MYEMKRASRMAIAKRIIETIEMNSKKQAIIDALLLELTRLAKKKTHINKRIQSSLKDFFKDDSYTVIYNKGDFRFEISVYNKSIGIDHSDRISLSIGLIGEDQIIDMDRIKELNPWFNSYNEMNERYNEFKAKQATYLRRYNAFVESYNAEMEFLKEIPYGIQELMPLPKV
jgi:hypothetical protein